MIRVGDSGDLNGARRARLVKKCAVHGCGHIVAVEGDICGFHAAMADKHRLWRPDRAGGIAAIFLAILAAVVWFCRGK